MPAAARMTWRFALVPALAVAALTVVMLASGRGLLGEELTRRALVSQQQRADLLALQLQVSLREAVTQVQLLARSPLLRPGAPPQRLRAELDHLVEHSPRFVWVGLTSPDGEVLAGSRGWLEGRSVAQRPVFQPSREGRMGDVHEAVLLAPMLASLPGGVTELLDIAEPVLDDAGRVVAIVTAHLGLTWVREQVALSLGDPEVAAAAGLRALVLTRAGARSVLPGAPVPPGLADALGEAQAWQQGGQRWLLAQAPLHGASGEVPLLPWRAVVLQSEDAALAPLHDLNRSMVWIGIAAALLLGGAGFWLSRRLLTPWTPIFRAVLAGQDPDLARVAARVQTLVAERARPTPTEMLMGWLARDADNLRRALDHLPVAVALADRQYQGEYVNPAFTRLLGWTSEVMQGRPVVEPLLDVSEREHWARLLHQLQAAPGEFDARLDALTPSGERVAVQCHLVPMFDAQGRQVGALVIVYDIRAERSARVRAEALSDRLHALADAALDTLLATLDVDGRVLEWSRGAQALTGHAPDEALGRTLHDLLPGATDADTWLRQASIDGQCPLTLPDGGRRLEGSLYRLGLAPGAARFGLLLRAATGVTAAAPLPNQPTRDELSLLCRRLLKRERQRNRALGHTLHDELGQTLAALRLHWEALRGAAEGQQQGMHERIAGLIVLANRQLRGVLGDLRPPLLDELGLAAALDNEIRQHHNGEGEARVDLVVGEEAQLQRWPADLEYAAFMIAREAILNALRHAGANDIHVTLEGDAQWLELVVTDDGSGFAPAHGQVGLVGMRERALSAQAELGVDAQPGHGTMVALTWTPSDGPADDEPHLPD